MVYDPNPLGPREDVLYCNNCLHLEPATGDEITACPVCGEVEPVYTLLDFAQPRGFRTNWQPRDYDGQFEWRPSASGGRLSPATPRATEVLENLEARIGGDDRLYVVNNNGGDGFRLAPARNAAFNGLFSVDLKQDPTFSGLRIPELDEGGLVEVALGARHKTDTLLLSSIALGEGLRLDPRTVSGKAVLYSAGFLLREAAARQLDVRGRELRVGLYVEPRGDETPRGWIFLADALENGAGYCTHLGKRDQLEKLFRSAREYLEELEDLEKHTCDSSCYGCLREYENQAYHALLDWRLGRDWVDVAESRSIPMDRWAEIEGKVATSFQQAFGGSVEKVAGEVWVWSGNQRLMMVAHPLEDTREDWWSERLSDAADDALDHGLVPRGVTPECYSSFDLLRRPGAVFAGI